MCSFGSFLLLRRNTTMDIFIFDESEWMRGWFVGDGCSECLVYVLRVRRGA